MQHIIFYADKNYSKSAVEKLQEFPNHIYHYYTEELLIDIGFVDDHKVSWDALTNHGCCWKPYIILDYLINKAHIGDTVIYTDCGDRLKDLSFLDDREIFLVETPHSHRRYTKKYCYDFFNCKDLNQLDAGFIALKKTNKVLEFLYEWEEYCYNPDLLLDTSIGDEWPDLIRHSRDQSILTALQQKYNLPTYLAKDLVGRYIDFNYRRG